MRAIDKGDTPNEDGENIEINEYGDARPYLIDRLGDYCSYCENQITNPAVEHILPKSISPNVETNWYNFLLACVNCNSIKGHSQLNLEDYYWPDIHNTYLLFEYHPLGVITLKDHLHNSVDKDIAQKTLELTGLNRYGEALTSDADRRWIKRSEAYGKAENALSFYTCNNRPNGYIQTITDLATSTGFWSVWIKIFENEIEVVDALTNSFKGTFNKFDNTDITRLEQ
ncbi:HNH endonuclease [Aquimarina rhabdastrellae]